jgi:GNAT superfamily N-acetyltransferase
VSTKYALVAGDPVTHKSEILGLLNRNLMPSTEATLARYRKYYESNPEGRPLLVLARESESQSYVGTCAIFPTRVCASEGVVRGGICGDFAVDDAHRGFGPAIALQQHLFDRLEEHGMSYVYGVPNPSSEAITQRVGYRNLGPLTRFAKILRLDIVLERYVGRESLVRLGTGVAPLTNPLLSLLSRERLHRRSRGFSVEKPESFDERFAAVWEAARGQARVTAYREATFLNWKFDKADPAGRIGGYSIFALMAGDEVVGYVAHATQEKVCRVLDIAFLQSQEVLDALLSRFLHDARLSGVSAVDLRYFGPQNLLTQRLRAFGFLAREHGSSLTVFAKAGTPSEEEFLDSGNWCLLPAAQDI